MDLEKVTSYIDALYEKRGLSKKGYIEATELQEFGTVVDDDVSRMLYVLTQLTRARRILEIGTRIGYYPFLLSPLFSYRASMYEVAFSKSIVTHYS